MRILKAYLAVPLGTRLVVAFALGASAGLLLGTRATALAPAARLLTEALRLLAPIVVAAFVLSGLSARAPRRIGLIAAKALAWYVGLAVIASSIGALVVLGLRPVGPMNLAIVDDSATPAWLDTLQRWTPAAGLETVVPIVFAVSIPLALGLGAWRSARPDTAAERVHGAVIWLAATVSRGLTLLLEYAPVGAFASAAVMFGQAGGHAGAQLAGVVLSTYAAHAVLAVVLCGICLVMAVDPFRIVRDSREALITALATGSSAATLPVELRVAEGRLEVPAELARTVMPLGTTFSKMGTTAFLSALGIVGGLASGHVFTAGSLTAVIAWSAVAGIATPPVSGGGFVMLALVFGQTGVPVGWVAILTSLPLIGKLNTPLNAFGRLLVAAALGHRASGSLPAAAPPA